MRHFILTISILFTCVSIAEAQEATAWNFPTVAVTASIASDTFKFGKDISIKITLTNNSNSIQSVWFDKPESSTGGPAQTSVILINRKSGKSVLKYSNKAILSSQIYSTEQVKNHSYHLKPGEMVSGEFSLYDLVVLLDIGRKLAKGDYEMQILYCHNFSNKIIFTVD